MPFSNRLKSSLVFVALGLMGAARAAILIDDFSSANQSVYALGPSNTFVVRSTGSMFGGSRAIGVSHGSNIAYHGFSTANVSNGAYTAGSDFGINGIFNVFYGSTGVTADNTNVFLTNVTDYNFTGNDSFKVDFLGNEKHLDFTVRLTSGVYDGVNFFQYLRTYTGSAEASAGPFSVTLTPADITFNDPNFDISKVDLVRLRLTNQLAGDFGMTSFEAVPEPASVAALALGALALLRRRAKCSI
jgi:hypothetical protein